MRTDTLFQKIAPNISVRVFGTPAAGYRRGAVPESAERGGAVRERAGGREARLGCSDLIQSDPGCVK